MNRWVFTLSLTPLPSTQTYKTMHNIFTYTRAKALKKTFQNHERDLVTPNKYKYRLLYNFTYTPANRLLPRRREGDTSSLTICSTCMIRRGQRQGQGVNRRYCGGRGQCRAKHEELHSRHPHTKMTENSITRLNLATK